MFRDIDMTEEDRKKLGIALEEFKKSELSEYNNGNKGDLESIQELPLENESLSPQKNKLSSEVLQTRYIQTDHRSPNSQNSENTLNYSHAADNSNVADYSPFTNEKSTILKSGEESSIVTKKFMSMDVRETLKSPPPFKSLFEQSDNSNPVSNLTEKLIWDSQSENQTETTLKIGN